MNEEHCDRKSRGPEGKDDQFGWILQFSGDVSKGCEALCPEVVEDYGFL